VLSVSFDQMVLQATNRPDIPQIGIKWGAGAYKEEHGAIGTWHWCSASCQVELSNPSKNGVPVRVEMRIVTTYQEFAKFTFSGPSISDTVSTNLTGKDLTYQFEVPPGTTALKFSSEAKRAQSGPDPRNLVFMVSNFTITSGAHNVKAK
jgi:hypothetical protein